MLKYQFGILSTAALSLLMLVIGRFLCSKIKFLRKFYIPAPVVGGLIFAVINLILTVTGVVEFTFDTTVQTIFMSLFFTSVGYMASLSDLKKGGLSILLFLIVVTVLITLQNIVGVGLASIFGLDKVVGLLIGSIPFSGGNGTASAWSSVFVKEYGVPYAGALSNAAATFGLVMGGIVGGPVGKFLFDRRNKKNMTHDVEEDNEEEKKDTNSLDYKKMFSMIIILSICMGVSEILNPGFAYLLHLISPNLTLPSYILSMILAVIVRNIQELVFKKEIATNENDKVGDIGLQIFLSIALTTLDLASLTKVGGGNLFLLLICSIVCETILVVSFASFVTYFVMGRNYDSLVISVGHCGCALGATPTAIANMDAFCKKNGKSTKAYLTVPIVGAMFLDFTNALIISIFLGILL